MANDTILRLFDIEPPYFGDYFIIQKGRQQPFARIRVDVDGRTRVTFADYSSTNSNKNSRVIYL